MLQIRRIRGAIEDDRTAIERFRSMRERLALARGAPTPDPGVVAMAQQAYDTSAKYDQRETSKQTWQTLNDLQDQLRIKLADLDKKRDTLRQLIPSASFASPKNGCGRTSASFSSGAPTPGAGRC